MPTPATVFDSNIDSWIAEGHSPWGRLRCTVTLANLRRHLGPGRCISSTPAAATAATSIPLAAEGHHVTIVDYSSQMLADGARRADASPGRRRAAARPSCTQLPSLFPEPCFDLVLCHNVLQYVDDVPALLANLAAPLRPGGLLSIVSVNRYATPTAPPSSRATSRRPTISSTSATRRQCSSAQPCTSTRPRRSWRCCPMLAAPRCRTTECAVSATTGAITSASPTRRPSPNWSGWSWRWPTGTPTSCWPATFMSSQGQ